MKRNPLWDAQAQQFLRSGVLQNSLARLAAPGAGRRPAPPAIPMSMIDRPIEPPPPAQPQPAPAPAPQMRPPQTPSAMPRPQQPVQSQQPQPLVAKPQQPQPFGDPASAPRMGEYGQAQGSVGGGMQGGVQRRPKPVAMPVANQGTPFQYRVSRGAR